jgi:hypothetical protein
MSQIHEESNQIKKLKEELKQNFAELESLDRSLKALINDYSRRADFFNRSRSTKWEYKCFLSQIVDEEDTIAVHGMQGWEMVSVTPYGMQVEDNLPPCLVLYKRPFHETQPEFREHYLAVMELENRLSQIEAKMDALEDQLYKT